MSDWKPVQCNFGPHWHEQPGGEKEQALCRIAMQKSIGPIIERLAEESEETKP